MTDILEKVLADADTAIDNWVLNQHEFDQECRIGLPMQRCGRPANWLQICRKCDDTIPSCNNHRTWLVLQGQNPHLIFFCGVCHATTRRLDELIMFVPIGYES